MKDKPIKIIRWPKAKPEHLIIIPCSKRRIRKRAIQYNLRDQYLNLPLPFNVASTKRDDYATPDVRDYQYHETESLIPDCW